MTNFAQLGIEIESKDAVTAATNLDNMAAAGKRAEKVTDDLKKSTTDWSAEQAKANARAAEMVKQDERRAASAKKANGVIQEQQKELGRLLGTIDPVVGALGRLDEQERKLGQFRKGGLIDTAGYDEYLGKLNRQRAALGGVSDVQGKAGMSAKAYSAAMRNVPAQITDITTSLIGGMPFYMVAIQQGGQLKDMFGGIVPAAKALATSLVAMINPVTVVGAGLGVIALAAYKGSQETNQFGKALALTGDAAGVTSDQLALMAASIDANSKATQASASRAIAEVVQTGKIASENFSIVADAAVQMNMATGKAVADTVAEFVKLADDPVAAIVKLNETQHFLTLTVYEQIKALQDQGKEQQAVALATQTYADATVNAANKVTENLGTLERAWKFVKIGASEAWDAMMGVGRDVTAAQELQKLIADNQRDLNFIQTADNSRIPGSEAAIPKLRADIMARYDRIKALNQQMESERATAEKKAAAQTANEVAIANSQLIDSQASKEEQRRRAVAAKTTEINSAIEKAKYAGDIKLAEQLEGQRAAAIAAIEKKYRDPKTANPAKPDINQAQSLIDSANRQIEANKQLADSGEAVSASRRKIIEIDQRMAEAGNLMTSAQRAQLEVAKEQLATTDKLAQARQQLTRDSAANAAMEERLAAASRQQRDQNEVSLMGIGRGSDATAMAQRQLDIRRDYLKQIDDLEKAQRNKNTALSAEELQKEKDMLAAHLQSQLAAEQSYQNQRMAMLGDWRNGANAAFDDYAARAADVSSQFKSLFESAFQGAEDAFVKFAMTGKLSFSDMAKSIIADLVRIAAKQAIVQGISAIGQAFGPTITGFAGGGYTGDGGKYQPMGVVHAGEVVWSQADVKAVGGPRAANAMRPTAGYANGGIVGQSQSRTIGQANAPQVTFIMNMQDGSISTQQQGQGDDSTRELKNMFEAMINQWWARNNLPGGAVYNGRMGTA